MEGHGSSVQPRNPSHSLDWWQQKLGWCLGPQQPAARSPPQVHRAAQATTTTHVERPTFISSAGPLAFDSAINVDTSGKFKLLIQTYCNEFAKRSV